MTDDAVRAQYEAYPYPSRDPADESKRLVEGSPSHIHELNHYVFGGRRDWRKPFRALVAGGGTGDGAIMLAQHLADAECPAEVIYLDLSDAARDIARARAEARGLANIAFHSLSLLDLPAADLGTFDYVDCCGVLHHLEDPAAGLKALAGVLAPDGGMGLMVYGELGRTGVYDVQAMLRTLASDDPPAGQAPGEQVVLAKRLLRQLPATNRFKRNSLVGDHLDGGDAGLYDLLLHSRDRTYRVAEIAALASSAGLRVTAFIEPARYDAASYINDRRILERLAGLSWLERAAFAELLAGNMRKHVFYAVKKANRGPVVADAGDPGAIPRLRVGDGQTLAATLKPGQTLTATVDGVTLRFPLPPLASAMIARMDGQRTLGAIHGELVGIDPGLDWDAFKKQFDSLYGALAGTGQLYLSFPPPR